MKAKAFLYECALVVHPEASAEDAEELGNQLPWSVEDWHAEVGLGQRPDEEVGNGERGLLQRVVDAWRDIVRSSKDSSSS